MISVLFSFKMDKKQIYNFNQICRFCLSEGDMTPIFDEEAQDNSIPLAFKIMACVHIQVNVGDGLPALLCHACRHQIDQFYQFKQQCQLSDSTLRHYAGETLGEPSQTVAVKQEVAASHKLVAPPEHGLRHDLKPRTHVCERCGRAFSKRRELSRHVLVHTGERPHPCPVCPKRFSRRDKLSRHIRTHGRSHLHNCLRCPESFASRDELLLHHTSHQDEGPATHAKPFRCNVCGLTYTRRDKLTRHQQVHAKIDPGWNPETLPMQCEDATSESLSRLGQNPEILLFPLPRPSHQAS